MDPERDLVERMGMEVEEVVADGFSCQTQIQQAGAAVPAERRCSATPRPTPPSP